MDAWALFDDLARQYEDHLPTQLMLVRTLTWLGRPQEAMDLAAWVAKHYPGSSPSVNLNRDPNRDPHRDQRWKHRRGQKLRAQALALAAENQLLAHHQLAPKTLKELAATQELPAWHAVLESIWHDQGGRPEKAKRHREEALALMPKTTSPQQTPALAPRYAFVGGQAETVATPEVPENRTGQNPAGPATEPPLTPAPPHQVLPAGTPMAPQR